MTWNLVIQRPKDPIKNMINQLKELQKKAKNPEEKED
jgi:hypothetical protein